MKKLFAKTSNVTNCIDAMDRLHRRPEHLPGMALVFGDPGLGKTRTMLWWVTQAEEAIYVRAIKLMTGPWLLSSIAGELGLFPARRTQDLWSQCVEALYIRPRTIICDEADYLAYDARILETLRDLQEITRVSVVLIGMGQADKKLKRYNHLWDRFLEVVRFHALTRADISDVAAQLCEVSLASDAIDLIHGNSTGFRQAMRWFYKAEAIARVNSLKEVTAAHLSNGNGGNRA